MELSILEIMNERSRKADSLRTEKYISIGTTNPTKIQAVEEVARTSPLFADLRIKFHAAPSGVSEQPMSVEETIQGAKNRAEKAFNECKYSIGLESGLMQAPGTKTGMIEFCACAIYDGEHYSIGISCGFELPPKILEMIKKDGHDMGEAYFRSGMTQNPKLGSAEGAIGLLSKGRVTRKDYTVQAIEMALLQFENPELYLS